MEALLIHWHSGLKFSSENRNPHIPEIGRKNRPIHPKQDKPRSDLLIRDVIYSYLSNETQRRCSVTELFAYARRPSHDVVNDYTQVLSYLHYIYM